MKPVLVLAICAFAMMPALAQAPRSAPPADAPKLDQAEIDKVVASISSDNTRTEQYCELGKLNQRLTEADQKNDTATLDTLGKQADDLEQKLGPDFIKFMDALDQMDDRSEQGKLLMAAVESLDKLCPK